MPPQFWVDFFVFAVVLGSGSTVAAADVLAMPQSTVSRKYRTFARSNGLTVLGKSGCYRLPPDSSYFTQLLTAFCEFRHFTSQYSCVVSIEEGIPEATRLAASDYTLFPGFVLFSPVVLPWMRESELFDFSLTVENIASKSGNQILLSGRLAPLSPIHTEDLGGFLRGFPFQFRELVSV